MQTNDTMFSRLGVFITLLVLFAFLVLLLHSFTQAPSQELVQTAMANGMGTGTGRGLGRGIGGGSAMMRFHQAEVPAQYVSLTNPIAAEGISLERGKTAYQTYCVACHGESGMGDGAAGQALDPKPAPIAQSSQMMSDGYLFWRISEGGAHFSTAMPTWEGALDEQTRWDLINYMRSLGTGGLGQGIGAGNASGDQAAAMVAAGVAAGVVTQAEADKFLTIHTLVEAQMVAQTDQRGSGLERQNIALRAMVDAKTITQADADTFIRVRDQLLATQTTQ